MVALRPGGRPPQEGSVQALDLRGWDLVSVFSMESANAALAKSNEGVMGVFTFSETPVVAAGRFGPWRLEPGGSGSQVQLAIPVNIGYLQGMPGEATSRFDGVVIRLRVTLEMQPSMPKTHDLVFGFDPKAPPLKSGGNPKVTLVGIDDPSGKIPPGDLDAISTLVVDGLNQQAGEVAHAFARLGAAVAQAMNWPELTATAFAYAESPPGTGWLGILGLTGTDDQPTDAKVPEQLLGAAPLVTAMTADLVLQRLVKPMLPGMVGHGTTDAMFDFDPQDHALIIKNATVAIVHDPAAVDVKLEPVTSGLVTYYPVIQHLKVTLSANQLVISATGWCDLYLGFSMTWSLDVREQMVFSAGASSVSFQQVGEPAVSYGTPPGPDPVKLGGPGDWLKVWLLEKLLGTIEDAVASGVTAGLGAHLGGMHFDQTQQVPIHWSGADGLVLTGATLDDSLVVTLGPPHG